MRFFAKSDPGRVRKINEDYYYAGSNFLAVADGLGGHNAGEIASKMVIEIFRAGLKKSASGTIDITLRNLLKRANSAVFERAMENQVYGGMGTTLTAAVPVGSALHMIHVGDSRAYLLRDGSLKQLTVDHSLVADMVKAGRLTFEEAKVHPQRSIITKALGTESDIEPDVIEIEILDGDKLLLCTDGLSSLVDDEEIEEVLARESGQEAVEKLISMANGLGGYDNITVVFAEFDSKWGLKSARKNGRLRSVQRREKATNSPIRWMSISLIVVLFLMATLAIGVVFSSLKNVEVRLEGKAAVIYRGYPGQKILGVPLYRKIDMKPVNPDLIEPFLKDRLLRGAQYESLSEAEGQLSKLPAAGNN